MISTSSDCDAEQTEKTLLSTSPSTTALLWVAHGRTVADSVSALTVSMLTTASSVSSVTHAMLPGSHNFCSLARTWSLSKKSHANSDRRCTTRLQLWNFSENVSGLVVEWDTFITGCDDCGGVWNTRWLPATSSLSQHF